MSGKRSDEPDMPASVERAKILAREFGQPTPALARLVNAVRQDAPTLGSHGSRYRDGRAPIQAT